MILEWVTWTLLLTVTNARIIELLECSPPDTPKWGGYGPVQEYYMPGDVVHYYCKTTTYIGGNFYRRCLDSGDWTGDTPVCDGPTTFSSVTQSSSEEGGNAESAIDGDRTTCSSTQGGQKAEWFGIFTKPGELIRVMLFLPKGPVSYEVVLVKSNGEEVVCGSRTTNTDSNDWVIQNCPGPRNQGASGLKIRSLNKDPLQICEIRANVLTSPKCVDPHVHVDGGLLRLDRHSATLVCNEGFRPSLDTSLECVRDGVWNRKPLYCIFDGVSIPSDEEASYDIDPRRPKPNSQNTGA